MPMPICSTTPLLPIAVGGDLSVDRLLFAYSNGVFPWYNPGEPILWWQPRQRYVIFPHKVHISRSMQKVIRKGDLQARINTDFAGVIRGCKMMREGETWITDEMEAAYNALFDAGHAFCVGVYEKGRDVLVGGLYGVVIGKCFFGESMFSVVPNASKLALIYLCDNLAADGFAFVDCQFYTEHLERMGGEYVEWGAYTQLLAGNLTPAH